MSLTYLTKVNDHVMVFNKKGLNDLINGPVKDLFKFQNNDTSVLVPFAEAVAVVPTVSLPAAIAPKPTSAELADRTVNSMALKMLCHNNVNTLENYFPLDSVVFGSHAVSCVLSNMDAHSPMQSSPFADPRFLDHLRFA